MLRQALILKVFQGASRSRRDCGNLEAVVLNLVLLDSQWPQSPRLRQS
jgi:hypothetical protein